MAQQQRGRVRVEQSPRRVRILLGGEWIADSTRAKYVWEKPSYPTYYLPAADVRTDLLVPTGDVHRSPSRGDAEVHDVKAGGTVATGAASWLKDSPLPDLADHIRFVWADMDAWFEEDEQVHVHPRDPYSRVDVLASSRHVRVEIGGVTIAETTRPKLLFETGLPVRYYIPLVDVRVDLLRASDKRTRCPYKGEAHYFSVALEDGVREDAVWTYPYPIPESEGIAGHVCFYNEHVDLFVDGELLERPRTVFS